MLLPIGLKNEAVIAFNSASVPHILIDHANDASKLTARRIYVIKQLVHALAVRMLRY